MPKHLTRQHRFMLTLPESMYEMIETSAARQGISQNQWIRDAIIARLFREAP